MKNILKAIIFLGVSLPLIALSLTCNVSANENLIANPSLETNTNSNPNNWLKDSWGQNSPSFSYVTNGQDGTRSVYIKMNSYSSGDAKWYFEPIAVTPNTQYIFSDYYKSSVTTYLVSQVEDITGNLSYYDLATLTKTTSWKKSSVTFTTPSNASKVTIFHLINRVGTLQTDTFSLSPVISNATPVPTAAPSVTPTLSPIVTQLPTSTPTITPAFTITPTVTLTPFPSATPTSSITPTPSTSSGPTATPAAGFVLNSSIETVSPTDSSKPSNWLSEHWGTNSAAFTYLNETAHSGTRAVKTEVTSYSSGDAKWYFQPQTVAPNTQLRFTDYYQSNALSRVVVEVQNKDGSYDYIELKNAPASGVWAKYTDSFTVPSNASKLTVFHLLSTVGFLITDDYQVTPYVPEGFNRPLLTLTFDDGWASQYTTAWPLLKNYNFLSTFYITTGFINTSQYMTATQITNLRDNGNQIAAHTITHPHLTTLTDTKLRSELVDSQTYLKNAFGVLANDFASPYGEVDARVLSAIRTYYRSHRGVISGYNYKDSFDIYDLKVQNILITTTPGDVQSWITEAKRTNSWLILVYHEVDQGGDLYSTTPANFASQLSVISQSGIPVVTLDQALNEVLP